LLDYTLIAPIAPQSEEQKPLDLRRASLFPSTLNVSTLRSNAGF
jgi:hypothetical protein